MKAIEFPEVNARIAENQPEYETLPIHTEPDEESNGYFRHVTMCFKLNEEEKKQVAETGCIWHTILQPQDHKFHPIKMSFLKPENLTSPEPEPDEQTKANIFKNKLKNERGETLVPGKIAMARVVDEGQYMAIEYNFIKKHGRKPSTIEIYEEGLQQEKEWLTQSILMKVPELIRFTSKQDSPNEFTIYAELDVLIHDTL